MDFCRNVSVAGGLPSEYPPEPVRGSLTGSLDDLFSAQNTEVDVSLEWLSIFVEDCFSSTGHSFPATGTTVAAATTTKPGSVETEPSKHLHFQKNNKPHETKQPLQQFVFPSKARTKRRRKIINATATTATSTKIKNTKSCWVSSDPPLLHQAYWLADSELISTPKTEECSLVPAEGYELLRGVEESKEEVEIEFNDEEEEEDADDGEMMMTVSGGSNGNGGGQARRCTHCLSQKTPQWRAGPLGPKTLCNACGVRYKSGRLLPEYRPAKSPTFVSYLHSNSHKKVLEMRMGPP